MNVAMIPPLNFPMDWACEACRATQTEHAARARRSAEFMERVATLSSRERQIMLLIARGITPAEMASTLQISVKTVSTYRARVLEKLDLNSNVLIALACERAGLLHDA